MPISAANAIAAYRNAAQKGMAPGAEPSERNAGNSFADFVTDALKGATDTVRKGEEASLKAAFGEANMVDVVVAVTTAEVTLQTVVAVRDRMIQAYQQILRMPM